MYQKDYLSRREILNATKNHKCSVCGHGFNQTKMPVVLPNRRLVHVRCQKET